MKNVTVATSIITNMNIFESSKKILLKIINDGYPFATALKSSFKGADSDPILKSNVTALVGCELRHHYLFANLIKRFCGDCEFDRTIYLSFYLSNKLFLKRFDSAELINLVYKDFTKDTVDKLLDYVNNSKELIPEELDKTSPEFLSYRFNTPAWVIRMWQKQYGKGLVFKILKANYHQSIPALRVDPRVCNSQELLDKHHELVASPVEDILLYQGKGNPKSLKEFNENKIFFMKMATKYLLDKLPIEAYKKMVIYSEVPNNIYLDLNVRLSKSLNLDLIINHVQSYFDTKKSIERLGIAGIDLYNTPASNLITCVSQPVDLLLCLPNSTSFDLLRSTPDYFLRIKQEKLDSILEEQKIALTECSKLVNENGQLVYMIPTLNKKESINMIGEFLAANRDFELVEDKQFFPFENYDSCLYYAILKKVGQSND